MPKSKGEAAYDFIIEEIARTNPTFAELKEMANGEHILSQMLQQQLMEHIFAQSLNSNPAFNRYLDSISQPQPPSSGVDPKP